MRTEIIRIFRVFTAVVMLASITTVRADDKPCTTALHEAATAEGYSAQGHIKLLKEVLKTHSINEVDCHGRTALHETIRAWDVAVSLFVIDQGIDLNIQDSYGETALMKAVHLNKEYSEPIVKKILENKSNINLVDKTGKNALMHVLLLITFHGASNKEDFADWLIDAGTDMSAQDEKGYTPLMKGYTALMLAGNHLRLATKILDHGAQLEATDAFGQTALMHAIGADGDMADKTNMNSVAKMLISRGANIEVTDKFGSSILMLSIARSNNDSELELELAKKEINFAKTNSTGDTALLWAARYNHPETLKILISRGAPLNVQDMYGNTPLIYSSWKTVEMVTALVSAGADPNIVNKEGRMALNYTGRTFEDTALPLLKYGAKPYEKNSWHPDQIDWRFDIENKEYRQAVIQYKNKLGQTHLIIAVLEQQAPPISPLIKLGINVNERDNDGKSALDYAKSSGNQEIIKLLQSVRN